MRSRLVLPFLILAALGASSYAQSTWTQMSPAASPVARTSHAMAYDAARQRTVLFGGTSGAGETWGWDGKNWARLAPVASPPSRTDHAMVYDSARGRIVMFGGYSSSKVYLADTWEWDGKNWAQIKPATSPPVRAYHAMAYDSARGRTVMFSGTNSPFGNYSDTWEWDGKNWAQIKPAISPPPRKYHAMAFDSVRGRTVLFGGAALGNLGDTWEWDGKNWMQLTPATSPRPRYNHTMAYDSARGRMILFGGYPAGSLAETWEWNGKNWTQLTPARSPSGRRAHAMVYDSARRCTMIFGGAAILFFLAETWEYTVTPSASFMTFGKACVGSNRTLPTTGSTGKPVLGKSYQITLSQARPNAPALFTLGVSDKKFLGLTLPYGLSSLGAPGCSVLCSHEVMISKTTGSTGAAAQKIAVPNNPWLLGQSVFNQWVVRDPFNKLQLVFSNASKSTFGR